MLKQPPSALGPALWIDVATVHPLAHSNMAKERARTQRAIAEFEEDPAAATPARLRRQPTLQAMVNFKKLKYQALNRAKALHENGSCQLELKIMKNPMKFIQEVKQEAFKVSWPTWKETLQGALMVFAMAVVMSLFFLLLDQVLKFFLELLLKVSI